MPVIDPGDDIAEGHLQLEVLDVLCEQVKLRNKTDLQYRELQSEQISIQTARLGQLDQRVRSQGELIQDHETTIRSQKRLLDQQVQRIHQQDVSIGNQAARLIDQAQRMNHQAARLGEQAQRIDDQDGTIRNQTRLISDWETRLHGSMMDSKKELELQASKWEKQLQASEKMHADDLKNKLAEQETKMATQQADFEKKLEEQANSLGEKLGRLLSGRAPADIRQVVATLHEHTAQPDRPEVGIGQPLSTLHEHDEHMEGLEMSMDLPHQTTQGTATPAVGRRQVLSPPSTMGGPAAPPFVLPAPPPHNDTSRQGSIRRAGESSPTRANIGSGSQTTRTNPEGLQFTRESRAGPVLSSQQESSASKHSGTPPASETKRKKIRAHESADHRSGTFVEPDAPEEQMAMQASDNLTTDQPQQFSHGHQGPIPQVQTMLSESEGLQSSASGAQVDMPPAATSTPVAAALDLRPQSAGASSSVRTPSTVMQSRLPRRIKSNFALRIPAPSTAAPGGLLRSDRIVAPSEGSESSTSPKIVWMSYGEDGVFKKELDISGAHEPSSHRQVQVRDLAFFRTEYQRRAQANDGVDMISAFLAHKEDYCLHEFAKRCVPNSKGNVNKSAGKAKQGPLFTCKLCWNNRRLCMRRPSDSENVLYVQPVPTALRKGEGNTPAGPSMVEKDIHGEDYLPSYMAFKAMDHRAPYTQCY